MRGKNRRIKTLTNTRRSNPQYFWIFHATTDETHTIDKRQNDTIIIRQSDKHHYVLDMTTSEKTSTAWAVALIVVVFDESHGQQIQSVYPKGAVRLYYIIL